MGKVVKLPRYSREEIKQIEREFDKDEGWVKADEILGKDRDVKSVFISDYNSIAKKLLAGGININERVKKILCNPVYTGIKPYPRIVSDED